MHGGHRVVELWGDYELFLEAMRVIFDARLPNVPHLIGNKDLSNEY